jgi:hypothetical protein
MGVGEMNEQELTADGWRHKDEWRKKGEHFLLVVSKHVVSADPKLSEGPNRWCLYAYIYPEHRLFGQFRGDDMLQPAAEDLPLHGGCSFLCLHTDVGGKITSIQVGADYNHLHDERFCGAETPEEAWEVFRDAEVLFRHLSPIKEDAK